jgi:hypothetical protein
MTKRLENSFGYKNGRGIRIPLLLGAALVALIGFASCKLNPDPNPDPTPPTPSSIDFSTIKNNYLNNLNEYQTYSGIQLPTKDKNGNPVTYTNIESQNPNVAQIAYFGGNTFSLTGESTNQDENYNVQVSYNDYSGKTNTTTLTGKLFDVPEFQGQVQSNEDHQAYSGTVEISYTDANGKGIQTNIVNKTTNPLKSDTIDSASNKVMYTDTNGNFDIIINERTDNIRAISLEAGIGSYTNTPQPIWGFSSPYSGPDGSFVRVLSTNQPNHNLGSPPIQTLSLGDNKNLTVYATPLTTLLNQTGNITTSQAFRTFFDSAESGYITKYDIQNVEIPKSYTNPDGIVSTFTYTQQQQSFTDATKLNDLFTKGTNGKLLRSGIGVQTTPNPPQNIDNLGWEVVVPVDSSSLPSNALGSTNPGSGGTESTLKSLILSSLVDPQFTYVDIHELSHGLIEPQDVHNYSTDSIFDASTTLSSPNYADKKVALIIKEEGNKAPENIDNYVLKIGF